MIIGIADQQEFVVKLADLRFNIKNESQGCIVDKNVDKFGLLETNKYTSLHNEYFSKYVDYSENYDEYIICTYPNYKCLVTLFENGEYNQAKTYKFSNINLKTSLN